tara:strand:- start:549 stop:767 length:219 start_codon:yes stop_codon:yes gene_type:complete
MIHLAKFALTRNDKDGGKNVYVNVKEIESVKEVHVERAVLYMKSGEVIMVKEKADDVVIKIMKGNGPGSSIF